MKIRTRFILPVGLVGLIAACGSNDAIVGEETSAFAESCDGGSCTTCSASPTPILQPPPSEAPPTPLDGGAPVVPSDAATAPSDAGFDFSFSLRPTSGGATPPAELVKSNNAEGCPRWGGDNTPIGETAPAGMADTLLRCPVGQMPYCAPKKNPWTFQCLSFTASMCKCVEAANATANPKLELFNGGAKKCCSLHKGGKEGAGHSAGIACSPNGKGGRRCCTVEAQCIGKFDADGNATKGAGNVSNGIRCCWDDGAAAGVPTVPQKCEQTLCPPGSFNCGDGNYDVTAGGPKFDDGLNPDHNLCRMVFDQATGLGREPREPVPLPSPVK